MTHVPLLLFTLVQIATYTMYKLGMEHVEGTLHTHMYSSGSRAIKEYVL